MRDGLRRMCKVIYLRDGHDGPGYEPGDVLDVLDDGVDAGAGVDEQVAKGRWGIIDLTGVSKDKLAAFVARELRANPADTSTPVRKRGFRLDTASLQGHTLGALIAVRVRK